MICVTLTWHEIYMGAAVGILRRIASLKRGETNKVQNKDFGWHTDIEGALAELAFAKAFNLHWNGSVNTFKVPDVGTIQIRHTQYPDGRLVVHDYDDDNTVHVLVTGTHPNYSIHGWLTGGQAKQQCFWDDPTGKFPAYFVPQAHLMPIDQIGFQ